jgi:hypothetical protein
MRSRRSDPSRQDTQNDVGTLWMLQKHGRTARCALLECGGTWELRVLVDREIVLTERCDRPAETFEIAELWKGRMLDKGWLQVVPRMQSYA